MRHALARLVSRDAASPTLRERFVSARSRLARVTGRSIGAEPVTAALAPTPTSALAVDRAALVNYATFLYHERQAVCAELYPHMGRKAAQFVLGLNAADRFFFTADGRYARRPEAAAASSRAITMLDRVGIDWREDADEASRRFFDDGGRADTGERPTLPHGWPAPDAALLEALDDLIRIDAALEAFDEAGDQTRDGDDVPGHDDLAIARDGALGRLTTERADSLTGLQAKARALLSPSVMDDPGEARDDLVHALARDLLGIRVPAIEPQPDPVLAVIDKARALMGAYDDAVAISSRLPDSDSSHDVTGDASNAMWEHIEDRLLKTVPRTAEGCKALARFGDDFVKAQEVSLLRDDDGSRPDPILALIARSPLL